MIKNRVNELLPCTTDEEVIAKFERFMEQELPVFQALISHTKEDILYIGDMKSAWMTYSKDYSGVFKVINKMVKVGVLTKISKDTYQVDVDLAREIVLLKFYQEEMK